MRNRLLLILVIILPVLALAQSRWIRVVNTIAELQSSNPAQIYTNVFVVDTNAGGIYTYYAGATSSVLPFVATTYTGATGIYVRTIPIMRTIDTNVFNLTMLSQLDTNTLLIGQNANTRLVAFADPASGISSYELDVAGVARMVLSVGTNANDNFIQVFDSNAVSVFKVAGDGSTYVGDTTNRVYAFVDRAAKISSLELDAGTLLRMILSAGTNATDNSFQMFDTNSAVVFKLDSAGNITTIRGSTYSWPSTNTTPGFLYNNGVGTLSFVITNNSSSVASSWSAVGTGADYAFANSPNYEKILFGTTGPSFTLTNAGTYQVMIKLAAFNHNAFNQHYYVTNITDTIKVPGSNVQLTGEYNLEGGAAVAIFQVTTSGSNRNFEIWGATDDTTYMGNPAVIATNSVVNVIRLY